MQSININKPYIYTNCRKDEWQVFAFLVKKKVNERSNRIEFGLRIRGLSQ